MNLIGQKTVRVPVLKLPPIWWWQQVLGIAPKIVKGLEVKIRHHDVLHRAVVVNVEYPWFDGPLYLLQKDYSEELPFSMYIVHPPELVWRPGLRAWVVDYETAEESYRRRREEMYQCR